jgi:hypothetical protein
MVALSGGPLAQALRMDVDDSRQQDHTADQIFKPETRAIATTASVLWFQN